MSFGAMSSLLILLVVFLTAALKSSRTSWERSSAGTALGRVRRFFFEDVIRAGCLVAGGVVSVVTVSGSDCFVSSWTVSGVSGLIRGGPRLPVQGIPQTDAQRVMVPPEMSVPSRSFRISLTRYTGVSSSRSALTSALISFAQAIYAPSYSSNRCWSRRFATMRSASDPSPRTKRVECRPLYALAEKVNPLISPLSARARRSVRASTTVGSGVSRSSWSETTSADISLPVGGG